MKKTLFAALFIAILLAGCAQTQAIKLDQPSQDQPAKAGKTFVDTFIQFFEPRD